MYADNAVTRIRQAAAITVHGTITFIAARAVVRNVERNERSMMRTDGLTPEEGEVMDCLIEAWNAFVNLPIQHPDDHDEFRHALHQIQNIVGMRVVRRNFKDWTNELRLPEMKQYDLPGLKDLLNDVEKA